MVKAKAMGPSGMRFFGAGLRAAGFLRPEPPEEARVAIGVTSTGDGVGRTAGQNGPSRRAAY
ncbi:hypothetical protein GCM10009602_22350 [Nocardiopsis tropica]